MELHDSVVSQTLKGHDDNNSQSSAKPEMPNGNKDDVNTVHSSGYEERELDVTESQSLHSLTHLTSDLDYQVTCMVSIALLVPKDYDNDPVVTAAEAKNKTKKDLSSGLVEVCKPQAYYHIEYNLLPDSSEPTKIDLVMYGVVAKLYMEDKTKVLKLWQEGKNVWLAWSQSVNLNVTKELLVKMQSHKITFRLWETKDKVSPKARFESPKALRQLRESAMEDQDQTGGIKSIVCELRNLYGKENKSYINPQRDISSRVYKTLSELNSVTVKSRLSVMETNVTNDKTPPPSALKTDGSLTQSHGEVQDLGTSDSKTKSSVSQVRVHFTKSMKDLPINTPLTCSSEKDKCLVGPRKTHKTVHESTEMEPPVTNSVATVEFDAKYLLAGHRSMTDRLLICSESVFEGFFSLSLDQPLMSEKFVAELNPLTITILAASSLPSSPVPFYELEQSCTPVYCQYTFHNMPTHRSKGMAHSSYIHFKDVNVVLTGLMCTEELFEFLRGPPLEIEVHDRDVKVKDFLMPPAIFGTEPNDNKLASIVQVTTKNSSKTINKIHNPYGIAKLNLSNLLSGHKFFSVCLPITCSHPLERLGNQNKTEGTLVASQENTLPIGHYLEANSMLKVQVNIAYPLDPDSYKHDGHCVYGRIIYIFRHNNVPVLTNLRLTVMRINALAFNLNSFTDEKTEKNLCGRQMTTEEKEDRSLNVLTGFHVWDTALHLFVLEGLKEQAIKELWKTAPIKFDEDVRKQVTVLYNSGLSFSKRLYDTLDVGLSPIHLHEPIKTMLQQSLTISNLCQVRKLKEAVQNNLFPSAEMIQCLRNEFRNIPSREVDRSMSDTKSAIYSLDHSVPKTRPYKTSLEWKECRSNEEMYRKNYITANIEDIHKKSCALQKPKPKVFIAKVDDDKTVHNYSIQTFNCNTLAKELLRKEMAKEPSRRFTYSQHYQSFTVSPVDIEAKSCAPWLTSDGFIYPHFKHSMESNQHHQQPDESIPFSVDVQNGDTYISQKAERENHSQTDPQTNTRYTDTDKQTQSKFGRYWRPHSFQHKKAALPLTDEEKHLHVFQKAQNTVNTYSDSANTQYKRNVIEMKTHDSIIVHIKDSTAYVN